MSVYSYRAPCSTKYEILIDNCKIERESSGPLSTCSEWVSKFDLNLDPIIFLRSTNAQLGVSHFTISELPLALNSNDKIEIWLESDLRSLGPNRIYNEIAVDQLNNKILTLEVENVTATDCATVVSYLNELLASIQIYLLYRYSLIAFDKQIWNEKTFERASQRKKLRLNPDELWLLISYSDAALFSRLVFQELILSLLNDDVTPLPPVTFSDIQPVLNEDLEERILRESDLLLTLKERQKLEKKEGHEHPTVTFSKFYGFQFAKESSKIKKTLRYVTVKESVRKTFTAYLKLLKIPVPEKDKPAEPMTDKQIGLLRSLLEDNETLIFLGMKLTQIANLELKKMSPDFSRHLFRSELISIELNRYNSTAIFHINNDVFLSDRDETKINVKLSENIAYCLGCDPTQTALYFGPLSHKSHKEGRKNTPERIFTSGFAIEGGIRPYAKIIRLATNVVSHMNTRDDWIAYNSEYSDFHIIHSQLVDAASLESKFIAKSDDHKTFYRLMRSENMMNSIKMLLLDENSRKISFPRNTFCRIGLVLAPFKAEDTH